jgi:hypothetical protein
VTDYRLATQPTLLNHTAEMPVWLADFADNQPREYNYMDAMAASGDFFVTLATRLDKLAQNMPADSVEQIELEHLVTTLFYLQEHWELRHKR